MSASPGAVIVEVPLAVPIRETVLEIRGVGSDAVVTALEILSPTTKLSGDSPPPGGRARRVGAAEAGTVWADGLLRAAGLR